MKLVIDANVLFAALIKHGNTRILVLFPEFDLYCPEFIIQEFKKHIESLSIKSGLAPQELEALLEEIINTAEIKIIKANEFINEETIKKIHFIDSDDLEYISLATELNCPLWSNDKELKKQSIIKIITTKELIEQVLRK